MKTRRLWFSLMLLVTVVATAALMFGCAPAASTPSTPSSPSAPARKSWATACEAVGLKGKLFHDLRRTAVRNMVRAGVPQSVAMAISGHRTTSIFNRYNITSADDLQKATTAITAYHKAQPKGEHQDKVTRVDFSRGGKKTKRSA